MREIILLLVSWVTLTGENLLNPAQRNTPAMAPVPVIQEKAADSSEAVVKIRGYRKGGRRSDQPRELWRQSTEGTGFIVKEDGIILTNRHVVENELAAYEVITSEGWTYEAIKISRHPDNDIAVVKIDPLEHKRNRLKTVKMGDSRRVNPGETVMALGNKPGKAEAMMIPGLVLKTGDTIIAGEYQSRRAEILHNLIQTKMTLEPGNSGSPLLDEEGEVVGINTATSREEEESYAIPINNAKSFLEQVTG